MKEIEGWLSPEVAQAMRDLILKTKPALIVEIGVFAGKSLINSALALRENGVGVIYGIDPWRFENFVDSIDPGDDLSSWRNLDLDEVHRGCMRAVWDNELEHQAVIIRATSRDARRLFRRGSIDVLYIDGAHSEERALDDTDTYLPRVKLGGYVWFDDANWPSTQKAVALLREKCKLVTDFGHCHLYKKL